MVEKLGVAGVMDMRQDLANVRYQERGVRCPESGLRPEAQRMALAVGHDLDPKGPAMTFTSS